MSFGAVYRDCGRSAVSASCTDSATTIGGGPVGGGPAGGGPDGFSLAGVAPIGLALLSPDDRLLWSNTTFADLTMMGDDHGCDLATHAAPVAGDVWRVAAEVRQGRSESARIVSVADRRLRVRAHVLPNTHADVMLSVEDITAETLEASARAHADRAFAAVFDNSPAGMAVFSATGHLLQANVVWSLLTGWAQAELVGRHFTELLPPGEVAAHVERLSEMYDLARTSYQFEAPLEHRDGGRSWFEIAVAVVDENDEPSSSPGPGEATRFVVSITDITERKATEDRLRADNASLTYLATHDHLTNLPNRSVLDRRLAEHVATGGSPMAAALLFCDLDGFKSVNDRYGHRVGDDALVTVARRMRAICSDHCLVARTGGDEFVVLAPASDPEDALALARRLVLGVRQPITIDGERVALGISIGVTRVMPGQSAVDALDVADELALSAKGHGGGVAWVDGSGETRHHRP